MKKVKRFVTAALAAVFATVSFSSMFSVSAASDQYYTYRYYFDVSAGAKITAYNANIPYNPSNATYVTYGTGNLGGSFNAYNIPVTTAQSIVYVNYINENPAGSSGYLGNVTLNTRTAGAPTVNVTLASGDDANGISIQAVLLGDVDLDGKVTEDDVTLLNKYTMNLVDFTKAQIRAADTNNDSIVDGNDAMRLLQYVEGVTDSVLG